MPTFQDLKAQGRCTPDQALALFDSLSPVPTSFMIGKWRGEDFPTGHSMDGHLATISWFGKEFIDENTVHPLVCRDRKGRFFNVDPKFLALPMALSAVMPRTPLMKRMFERTRSSFTTTKPRARLRMVEVRGRSSATMIYDHRPILDTFREVDENTVLGLMDLRGFERPYFFALYRYP
jgi:hypothetical protein